MEPRSAANKLRIAVVWLMAIVAPTQGASAEEATVADTRVDQMSFCGARGAVEPTCERPIIEVDRVRRVAFNELPTFEGKPIVWVWSTSTTAVDTKIAYLFIQESTGKHWSKAIHVHWIDRASSILDGLVDLVRDGLAIIHQPAGYKFTQAAGFLAKQSNKNRWPARFNIEEPGTFHLSVIRFGANPEVVRGGERMTLLVD
jgi:hypothetical protein